MKERKNSEKSFTKILMSQNCDGLPVSSESERMSDLSLEETTLTAPQSPRRNRLARFLPRTMFNQSVNREEPQINELENTCSSSRSSFAELWDSSIPIEIRDGSIQKGSVFNPTSAVLHMCNRQVMAPYFFMLSVIGWRPLFRESRKCRRIYQGLNALYLVAIFLLLIYSYVSSIVACQSRLDIMESTKAPISTVSPTTHYHNKTTVHPTTAPNVTHNTTTIHPIHPTTAHNVTHNTTTTHSSINHNGTTALFSPDSSGTTTTSEYFTFKMVILVPAKAEWRPTECTHILSGYIVPDLLHFVAFIVGFYHFRIQESEGLQALIEMVFLQSRNQTKVVKRLRSFLIVGAICLVIATGAFILFVISFGLPSITGFHNDTKHQWVSVCFMVLGNVVEDCVTFVVILNYCAQCQLLIFYSRDIVLRMEEKTAELGHTMKDIWEVKKYVNHINGVAAHITTMIVFNYCELAVIGLCILLMEPKHVPKTQLAYRAIVPIICVFTLSCPVIMGTLLTKSGQMFKQLSLQIRVFGYPSTTQFDRDSFLLFVQHTDLKPKLFSIPLKTSYMCGLVTVIVFIVLLLMQTNTLAGNNKYL